MFTATWIIMTQQHSAHNPQSLRRMSHSFMTSKLSNFYGFNAKRSKKKRENGKATLDSSINSFPFVFFVHFSLVVVHHKCVDFLIWRAFTLGASDGTEKTNSTEFMHWKFSQFYCHFFRFRRKYQSSNWHNSHFFFNMTFGLPDTAAAH